jgi:hypothetical protein
LNIIIPRASLLPVAVAQLWIVSHHSVMQSKSFSFLFAYASVFIGIAGCLAMCWLKWRFYEDVSTLPPGTGIRPIGEAINELEIGVLTLVLAIPLSLAGISYSIRQHRLVARLLSFSGLFLGIVPLPLGIWLGHKIIAATGVVLEP